jgi:membrane fusion protein, adhesin transport system
LFQARRQQLNAQISVLKAQASQRKQEIGEMASRRKQLKRSLQLAREELAITEPLARSGVVPRIDLLRINRQVADLEGEYNTVRLSVPRLKTAAEEAAQRIVQVQLAAKAEASDELNRVRAEFKSVRETLFAGEDRVTRTEVRSPVRGTVKEIKVNTVGGVIRPGQDIVEIVPLDDSLLVEARIRPKDIAFLRPGQESIIKVAAYDFSIYGGLKSRLEQISADTIRDEEGENFYRVYLRTERNTISHQGNELPIIPGMTATVEILTGKKTVLDYLLKPILKARQRALRER